MILPEGRTNEEEARLVAVEKPVEYAVDHCHQTEGLLIIHNSGHPTMNQTMVCPLRKASDLELQYPQSIFEGLFAFLDLVG
jgi:hypothetical protein